MEVPRHWRLKQQRYALVGEICPHCEGKIFPPRDVCPHCGGQIDLFKTGGGESLAQEMGVPFLGGIPIDPQIVACGDEGVPYTHRFAESPAAKAFAAVVERIVATKPPVHAPTCCSFRNQGETP